MKYLGEMIWCIYIRKSYCNMYI